MTRQTDAQATGRSAAKLLGLFTFLILVALIAMALSQVSASESPVGNGWTPIVEDDFESGLGVEWTAADLDGSTNGEYYWATSTFSSTSGTTSLWATGGGADGSGLTPGTDDYPNNALSSLIHSAVNLTGTTQVRLRFDYWLATESPFDALQVRVSTDGVSYTPVETWSGGNGQWESAQVDLSAYAGEETFQFEFFFSSNGAVTDAGVFIDDVVLEGATTSDAFMPFIAIMPTFTPTPTPTATPYAYFDDFSDPSSGWPIVDNTGDPSDCFRWYYDQGEYKSLICDDRTDVKVSPLVDLPDGDYELSVDARFRYDGGFWYWTSYGIIFDGKDDPNPANPNLGDYYMIWVLWEDTNVARWMLLKDVPGDQFPLIDWQSLNPNIYDYGDNGSAWNNWRIVRTETQIQVYLNDTRVGQVNDQRVRDNFQTLFGVFSSTYETGVNRAAYDNYRVESLDGTYAWSSGEAPFFISGDFGAGLQDMLPPREGE